MSYYDDDDQNFGFGTAAIDASLSERSAFIRRTYLHLTGAVLAFVGLTGLLLNTEMGARLGAAIFQNWWMALIAFWIVSWLAQKWAYTGASEGVQYAGLALYTVCEAVIFVPILWYAKMTNPDIIPAAGIITLVTFGGLTAVVMITKTDFSFLRGILQACMFAAFGMIIASLFMNGFTLGIGFAAFMIVVMSGWILYSTSDILRNYPTNMHVAAALTLFSSLATLFWYVIRLLIILNSDD